MVMRRFVALLLVSVGMVVGVSAQHVDRPGLDVVAYYDEADILKQDYRESPYYLELTGSWKQRRTDSSVVYSRQVEAAKSWKDYQAVLGVRCGKACRVYLNGKVVGYADDSRHMNMFLLDKYLKYGKLNDLAIEALSDPVGALLEDSSISVGLNGEPFIMFKNDPCVDGLDLVADYDATTGAGTLSVGAQVFNSKRKGRFYVEVEVWTPEGRQLDRMGRWVVFDKRSEETVDLSRTWTDVEPWSAESPSLYTAVVRLRNEKMEEEETVGLRFGFRTVEIKDGVLMLNGKPLTLKGVCYSIEHTEGQAARDRMRNDVVAMKRNNINAVRTSPYSPMDSYFYSLCDQYGLYVVADANLMPASSQHRVVATDQDFIPLFEKRVENLYLDCRNHSSIVAWSLGNSRDNGVCMTAAYKRLKAIDGSRPVVFAGAGYGESTDMVAFVSPRIKDVKQAMSKQSGRPFVMLKSVDEDELASLEPLWQMVPSRRGLQGGFVERWPMGGVALSELRHLYSPIDIKLSKITPDEGEFIVFNRNDFGDFRDYSLEYVIYTNKRPNIIAGDLPLALRAGESDKVSMRIPQMDLQPGEEFFIMFTLNSRKASRKGWADGAAVDRTVFRLPQEAAARPMCNDLVHLQWDTIPDVSLSFKGHADWAGHVLASSMRQSDGTSFCQDRMISFMAPDGTVMCDVRATSAILLTGDVVVDYSISATDALRDTLLVPVASVAFDCDSLLWFGLDRQVLFANGHSGLVGRYAKAIGSGIDRRQVRWCAAVRGDGGLFAEVLDQQFEAVADAHRLLVSPEGDWRSFRVHLRKYDNHLPDDLYGFAYPSVTAGIVAPPVITASDVKFSKPLTVTLSSPVKGDIRYSLDGSEPTEASARYTAPFVLTATTVVKARTFAVDGTPSFTASRRFNYDYIVGTKFSRKPNTPYNANADAVLFDGLTGNVDDFSRGWLGFSGKTVTTTIELAEPIDVESVVLRYAHSPATWAFAPRSVVLSFSADGEVFTDTLTVDIGFDPADEDNSGARVVELSVPVRRHGVGFVRIEPVVIDKIPSWHRAKGLKPWLMMDEVRVTESIPHKNEKE